MVAAFALHEGDVLDVLRTLPSESFDGLLSDPPAGISFMGKAWDGDKGGRDQWIAWLADVMREALRVLRPGAHVLVWALPRTSHWTATAIENAGFEVRDVICHLFGSGFPKSSNVSKMIDAANGDERAMVNVGTANCPFIQSGRLCEGHDNDVLQPTIHAPTTRAGSAESERWAGQGTALKPAMEAWILARKPLDGTIAHNATTHGTGGINVDGCRVAHAGAADLEAHVKGVEAIRAKGGTMDNSWANASDLSGASEVNAAGRWPTNLVLTHSIDCVKTGTRMRVRTIFGADPNGSAVKSVGFTLGSMAQKRAEVAEVAEVYSCVEGCPVRELDEQSGDRPSTPYPANDAVGSVFPMVHRTAGGYSDSGGASRFFPQFQWTTEDLCAAADIAGATFHPETTRITSAPIDAPDLPAQESADKPVRSHGTARNAASHASPTAEPSGDFARCAAPVSANVNASQRARGVDTSSTHTETCIVPNLANQSRRHENASAEPHTQEIESGSPRSFERSTETIPNTAGNASPAHARTARTPSADIVDNAATQTPIDIMTTTASRRISVGSAAGATYVTTATPEDLGEAGFAKFRYEPKASRYERDFGCDDLPLRTAAERVDREPGSAGMDSPRAGAGRTSGARNSHPTIKSVALTKWLATLLLPPPRADGAPRRIVVPFLGSGSEAVGALRAGWEHVEGIEREADFVAVARARLERWAEVPAHVEPTASKSAKVDERQVSLFGRSP